MDDVKALLELKDSRDAKAGPPGGRAAGRAAEGGSVGLPTGAIALAVAAWIMMPGRLQPPLETTPLTTYPGLESSPSFSPDGNSVAFCWNGPKQDNLDIYVKLIGAEKPLRLTSDPAREYSPAWSPDGRSIAFQRELPEYMAAVFLIPAIGGTAHKLGEIPATDGPGLTWSIDGKWLVYADIDSNSPTAPTASLYALSVETGERRRLRFAPQGGFDFQGAFSPDGHSLVFVHAPRGYSSELYLLAVTGDLRPKEKPIRITALGRISQSPAWTPDGRQIVFMSGTTASTGLWRMPVSGSQAPQRLEFAGDRVGSFAVSPRRNRLVFERRVGDLDIWRVELNGGKAGPPTKLIASTWDDSVPQYSPDGKRIAFDTTRSGYSEVWLCSDDGADPIQLTFLSGQQAGPPRWSPDGKQIVFDDNVSGNFEVYVIDAAGGRPRRLTEDPADNALPSFSHDGRWIYFTSSRTGRYEMWKMPAGGGKPVQVTRNGGWVGFESPDAKHLYYATYASASSLWRIPVDGGAAQKVEEQIMGSSLVVANRGIYFARVPQPAGGNRIEFLSFSSGKTMALTTTQAHRFLYVGFSRRAVPALLPGRSIRKRPDLSRELPVNARLSGPPQG